MALLLVIAAAALLEAVGMRLELEIEVANVWRAERGREARNSWVRGRESPLRSSRRALQLDIEVANVWRQRGCRRAVG